jgi:hypothetical protein
MASASFCAFYGEKPLYPQLLKDFFTGMGFFLCVNSVFAVN